MCRPFFSVVIPTYNRTDTLEKAISSIIQQTFEDWEIIIVDDGGDSVVSRKMLTQFSDERIKYFWKENGERSIARNYGFNLSEGRYVVPLDSDDQILPMHLQNIFQSVQQNGEMEFFHTSFVIEDDKRNCRTSVGPFTKDQVASRIIYENIFAIGAGAIRRDVACQLPFPNSPCAVYGEDWFFYLRIFARFGVCWVEASTFLYVVNSNSSVRNIDPEIFCDSYNLILSEILDDDDIKGTFGIFNFCTMIGFQTLGIALQYLISDERKISKSFLYLRRGLRAAPWLVVNKRFLVCLRLILMR